MNTYLINPANRYVRLVLTHAAIELMNSSTNAEFVMADRTMPTWDNLTLLTKLRQSVRCVVACHGFTQGNIGVVVDFRRDDGAFEVKVRWDDCTCSWVNELEYDEFLDEI